MDWSQLLEVHQHPKDPPLLASSSQAFSLIQACLLLCGWPASSNNKGLCELPFIPQSYL